MPCPCVPVVARVTAFLVDDGYHLDILDGNNSVSRSALAPDRKGPSALIVSSPARTGRIVGSDRIKNNKRPQDVARGNRVIRFDDHIVVHNVPMLEGATLTPYRYGRLSDSTFR